MTPDEKQAQVIAAWKEEELAWIEREDELMSRLDELHFLLRDAQVVVEAWRGLAKVAGVSRGHDALADDVAERIKRVLDVPACDHVDTDRVKKYDGGRRPLLCGRCNVIVGTWT